MQPSHSIWSRLRKLYTDCGETIPNGPSEGKAAKVLSQINFDAFSYSVTEIYGSSCQKLGIQ